MEAHHEERRSRYWNSTSFFDVFGAPRRALEKQRERFISTEAVPITASGISGSIASGEWDNVGKRSRQIRSVTLGKGLALQAAQGGASA